MRYKNMCTIKFILLSIIGVGLIIFGIVFASLWQGMFDKGMTEVSSNLVNP
jgi:hypothetical protein